MQKILFASLFLTTLSLNAFAMGELKQEQINKIIDKKEVIVTPPPKEEPKVVQAPVEQKPVEQKPVEQKPVEVAPPVVQTPPPAVQAPVVVPEAPKTKWIEVTKRRRIPSDPLDNSNNPRGGSWETYTERVEVPVDAPVQQKPIVDQKPVQESKSIYVSAPTQQSGGHGGDSSEPEEQYEEQAPARQRPAKDDLGFMSTDELINNRIGGDFDISSYHGVDVKNCSAIMDSVIDDICTIQRKLQVNGKSFHYKHADKLDDGYKTLGLSQEVKGNSKMWLNNTLWAFDKRGINQGDYVYGECSQPKLFGLRHDNKHTEIDLAKGDVTTSEDTRTANQYCTSFNLKHSIYNPAKFFQNKLDTVRKLLKDAETDGSVGAEDRREGLRKLERKLVSAAMNPAVQSAIAAFQARRDHDGFLNSKSVLSLRGPRAGIRITKNMFRRAKNLFKHNKEELIPRDDAMTQYSLSGDVINSEDFSAYADGSSQLSLEDVFGDKRGNYIRNEVLNNRSYGKSTARSVASLDDDGDLPPAAPDRFRNRGGLAPR